MSSRKGDRAERELSNWLEDEADWYAQRTGSSGGATDRARPDVIAARRREIETDRSFNDVTLASHTAMIEVKAATDGTIHLDAREVDEHDEAARRAGAGAWVVVRPSFNSHDQWHVFDLHELHETDGGNYSVRKSDLPGRTLEEVFG